MTLTTVPIQHTGNILEKTLLAEAAERGLQYIPWFHTNWFRMEKRKLWLAVPKSQLIGNTHPSDEDPFNFIPVTVDFSEEHNQYWLSASTDDAAPNAPFTALATTATQKGHFFSLGKDNEESLYFFNVTKKEEAHEKIFSAVINSLHPGSAQGLTSITYPEIDTHLSGGCNIFFYELGKFLKQENFSIYDQLYSATEGLPKTLIVKDPADGISLAKIPNSTKESFKKINDKKINREKGTEESKKPNNEKTPNSTEELINIQHVYYSQFALQILEKELSDQNRMDLLCRIERNLEHNSDKSNRTEYNLLCQNIIIDLTAEVLNACQKLQEAKSEAEIEKTKHKIETLLSKKRKERTRHLSAFLGIIENSVKKDTLTVPIKPTIVSSQAPEATASDSSQEATIVSPQTQKATASDSSQEATIVSSQTQKATASDSPKKPTIVSSQTQKATASDSPQKTTIVSSQASKDYMATISGFFSALREPNTPPLKTIAKNQEPCVIPEDQSKTKQELKNALQEDFKKLIASSVNLQLYEDQIGIQYIPWFRTGERTFWRGGRTSHDTDKFLYVPSLIDFPGGHNQFKLIDTSPMPPFTALCVVSNKGDHFFTVGVDKDEDEDKNKDKDPKGYLFNDLSKDSYQGIFQEAILNFPKEGTSPAPRQTHAGVNTHQSCGYTSFFYEVGRFLAKTNSEIYAQLYQGEDGLPNVIKVAAPNSDSPYKIQLKRLPEEFSEALKEKHTFYFQSIHQRLREEWSSRRELIFEIEENLTKDIIENEKNWRHDYKELYTNNFIDSIKETMNAYEKLQLDAIRNLAEKAEERTKNFKSFLNQLKARISPPEPVAAPAPQAPESQPTEKKTFTSRLAGNTSNNASFGKS